jgi:hypothetical protein
LLEHDTPFNIFGTSYERIMWQLKTSLPERGNSAAVKRAPTAKLRVGFALVPRFTMTAFAGFIDTFRLAAGDGDHSRQIACESVFVTNPKIGVLP